MAINTITIGAGESAYLPTDSKILAVESTGAPLTLSSDCMDVTPEPRICMRFLWLTDNTSGPDVDNDHPWDDGTLVYAFVKGTTYYNFDAGTSGINTNLTALQNGFPYQAIIQLLSYTNQPHEVGRKSNTLTVSVPSSFSELYLQFAVPYTDDDTKVPMFAKGLIITCEPTI